VERTARLSPRQLRIAPLAEELTRLQRDDRVNARVEQLDAVEERIHDLDARELPGLDRGGQCERVQGGYFSFVGQ